MKNTLQKVPHFNSFYFSLFLSGWFFGSLIFWIFWNAFSFFIYLFSKSFRECLTKMKNTFQKVSHFNSFYFSLFLFGWFFGSLIFWIFWNAFLFFIYLFSKSFRECLTKMENGKYKINMSCVIISIQHTRHMGNSETRQISFEGVQEFIQSYYSL